MHLRLEGGAHVRHRRLAVIDVEHRGLDADHAALGRFVRQGARDLADHVQSAALARLRVETIQRLPGLDQRQGAGDVHPVRIDHRAMTARGDGDDAPFEIQALGHFRQQPHEPPPDVAEPDQDERQRGRAHAPVAATRSLSASDSSSS